jgi:hypothetical protein
MKALDRDEQVAGRYAARVVRDPGDLNIGISVKDSACASGEVGDLHFTVRIIGS